MDETTHWSPLDLLQKLFWKICIPFPFFFFAITSVDEEAFEAAALIIILRLWRIVRVVNGEQKSFIQLINILLLME